MKVYLPSMAVAWGSIMFSTWWALFRMLEWHSLSEARYASSWNGPVIAGRDERRLASEYARSSRPEIVSFVFDDNASRVDTICAICLGEIGPGCSVGQLPCKHSFHDYCIREWLKHGYRCPMRCSYGEIDGVCSSEGVPAVAGRAVDLEPSPRPSVDV